MAKLREFKIPGVYKRTVIKQNDPENYSRQGVMAGTVYGDGKYPIKKKKIVISENKLTGTKTRKSVDYGPVNYYGKQTKTIKKTKTKLQ